MARVVTVVTVVTGLRKGHAVDQGVVAREGAKALAAQDAPHLGKAVYWHRAVVVLDDLE